MFLAPLLVTFALARSPGYPKSDAPAPVEDAKQGPLDVCAALIRSAKDDDIDAMLGHATAYARTRFAEGDRLALRAAHDLLISLRCVRVSSEDDAAKPAQALVWVYAPRGKSRDVPFVKENGYWRFDQR